MDIYIDQICVEVFEKTIRRTEMINHPFERKFYGAWNRLYKKFARRPGRARYARKVLKLQFYYDAVYQSLRKLYQSIS